MPGAPVDMYWALGLGGQVVQVDPGSDTVRRAGRVADRRLSGAPEPETAAAYGPAQTAKVVMDALVDPAAGPCPGELDRANATRRRRVPFRRVARLVVRRRPLRRAARPAVRPHRARCAARPLPKTGRTGCGARSPTAAAPQLPAVDGALPGRRVAGERATTDGASTAAAPAASRPASTCPGAGGRPVTLTAVAAGRPGSPPSSATASCGWCRRLAGAARPGRRPCPTTGRRASRPSTAPTGWRRAPGGRRQRARRGPHGVPALGLFRGCRTPVPVRATVRSAPEGVEAVYEGEPRPPGVVARRPSPRTA